MYVGAKVESYVAQRCVGIPAAAFTAAAIFALSLVAPVTIDVDSGMFTLKTADAKNGNGGGNGNADDGAPGNSDFGHSQGNGGGKGNGGGNGGGNGNGNGNGNGGGNGNGNGNGGGGGNGGDSGNGNGIGKAKGKVAATTNPDAEAALLLAVSEPGITLAQFTTKISKRYPADEITDLDNPHQAISFFSEVQDMSGQTVMHLWRHGGEVEFKASFKIRANHWRVWSTQLLPQNMPGQWTVEVVNQDGEVLEARVLNFTPRAPALAKN